MFNGCSSISTLKGLEKWNVSNVENFSCMFQGCLSLSDITALEKWKIVKGNNFSYMFNDEDTYLILRLYIIGKFQERKILKEFSLNVIFQRIQSY